ncbi:cold-shock protein [Neisseria sp. N95_16]|nr:cold-shock protein [Neisseria sp. N95_16]PJO77364.1 cold-shock protein [Neisseria sp. N177_16]
MAGFSDGIKICRLYFEIFLYYAQIEYNKQGRLKTALVYNKVFS